MTNFDYDPKKLNFKSVNMIYTDYMCQFDLWQDRRLTVIRQTQGRLSS